MSEKQRKKKTLQDFRAAFDKDYIVPQKIREALKTLGSSWETELDFSRLAAVTISDVANYREQFSDYVVHLRKDRRRVWCGDKAMVLKMREMV